jgi:Tfp pilus assembly protein PilX
MINLNLGFGMRNKMIIINNENGSAIVLALIMLAILTIIGISSSTTSTIELQIVRNERIFQRDFYIADSIWKYGAYWLEDKSTAPPFINTTIVRNFGDGAAGVLNNTFPDGTEDGSIDTTPYWYNIEYNKNEIIPGSGQDYRKFYYLVKSNANKKQEIDVGVAKVYKIGY